ncbi:hypothetical protein VI817_007890 [Penicillium citrinum]|nr:hypothetical protein VI817_007890 [Penicillium citrinum]
MPRLQDQQTDDSDSSPSDTTSEPNDLGTIDLTFSDEESDYVTSEANSDQGFVASDNETLSYFSDTPSEKARKPVNMGQKKPMKPILRKSFYVNGRVETCVLVVWYSWEKEENFDNLVDNNVGT